MTDYKPKPQTNYLNLPSTSKAMPERVPSPNAPILSSTWQVTFKFGSETTHLPVGQPILVGRESEKSDEYPVQLDLSPYAGYQGGVSRKHAQITFQNGALYIEDLGSTNGTRINGFQLTPHRKYRLRDGDELEFGRLLSNISFSPALR